MLFFFLVVFFFRHLHPFALSSCHFDSEQSVAQAGLCQGPGMEGKTSAWQCLTFSPSEDEEAQHIS